MLSSFVSLYLSMKTTYQTLTVWQVSIDLVEQIYVVTRSFPEDEKFNVVSQMRRCAVSIPSNIAEGHGRKSGGDFIRFLRVSFGSTSELETQLHISKRLQLIDQNEFDECDARLTAVRKMLNKLIKYEEAKLATKKLHN